MVSGVVVTFVNIAVLAVGYPIYLHFLGYEQYGLWLVLSTVLTFAQLGNLGIGQALMKLVAEEYGRNDLKAVQEYMTSAIAILVASGAVVLGLVILLNEQIVGLFKLSAENAKTVSLMMHYMACLSIYVFIVQGVNAMLSGFGRMDLANYAETGGRLVAVFVAGVLVSLGTGIEGLLIGSAASYVFMHGLSIILTRRIASIRILRAGNLSILRMRRLFGFGSGVLGGSLLSMLLSPFNKLVLSRYAGVALIPVYEIAYNGSMQVRRLVEAALRALMPEISRVGASATVQAMNRISKINSSAMKVIFLFGVPAYLALILFARPLLTLWLGSRFTEVLPDILRVMLLGTFMSLCCVPAYYTLMGLGKVRQCFLSNAIQGIVNAGGVGTIILLTGEVSIRSIALVVAAAMGATSFYVIWKGRCAMLGFRTNESDGASELLSDGKVVAASQVDPEA